MPTAEQVLAQMGEEYCNAPRIPRWQPQDGEYTDIITAVNLVMFGKKGQELPTIFVLAQPLEGDDEGRTHVVGRFSPNNFGMLADLVELMGGAEMSSATKALAFLQEKVGTAVTVRVETRGQYQNANIVGVVPDSAVAE